MNPKFRALYLLLGFVGLAVLIYEIISTLPDVNPINVLIVTVPDMLFFFLAYKTYPVEETHNA
jgi:uncharacterized membrane protein